MSINKIKADTIRVKYNGKNYTIDITKELSITTSAINNDLIQAPSNYAFLCLIRDKYIHDRDKLERDKDIAYAEAWVYYKESTTPPPSNDLTDQKASINSKYTSIYERYLKSCNKANQLISICKAYESREKIMQTLSANIRKTN